MNTGAKTRQEYKEWTHKHTLMRGWGAGGVRLEKDRWGKGMEKHNTEGGTGKKQVTDEGAITTLSL